MKAVVFCSDWVISEISTVSTREEAAEQKFGATEQL